MNARDNIPPAAAAARGKSLLAITHKHTQRHAHQSEDNADASITGPYNTYAEKDPTARADVELGGVYALHDDEGTMGVSPQQGSPLPVQAISSKVLTPAELTHSDFLLLAKVHEAWDDFDTVGELRAVLEAIPLEQRRFFIDLNMGADGLGNLDDFLCAIHHLVWDDKLEHIRVLLELGGNVDVVSIKPFSGSEWAPYHQTPLHIACSLAQEDIVRLLCSHGADPNKLDSAGLSPLQRLVEKRSSPMDKVLRCLKIMLPLETTNPPSSKVIPVDKTRLAQGAVTNVLVSRAKTSPQAAEAIEYLVKAGFTVPEGTHSPEGTLESEEGLPLLTRHQKSLRYAIFSTISLLFIGTVAGYLSKYGRFDPSSCDETIFGVIPTPYLVAILNQFFFRFLKWGFEMSLLPLIYRTLGVYCCACCFKREGRFRKDTGRLTNIAAFEAARPSSSTMNPISSGGSAIPTVLSSSSGHSQASSRTQSMSRSSLLHSFSFRQQKMDFVLRGLKAYIRQTKSATYQGPDALLTTPWLFLYFQATIGYFVVLFTAVWCKNWAGAKADAYDQYTTFYGILVNSAVSTSVISLWIFFTSKKERRTAAHQPRDLSWSLFNLAATPYRHLLDLLDESTFASRLQQLRHAWRSDKVVVLKFGGELPEGGGYQISFGSATLARCVAVFLTAQVLIFLPPLLSHIIPAFFLYGWIVLCGAALLRLSSLLMHSMILSRNAVIGLSSGGPSHRGSDDIVVVLRHLSHLLSKILQRFVFLWMLQTTFIYAALWYARNKDADNTVNYFGVVLDEFALRSKSYCFFFEGLNKTRVRGTIMLLSWL